jgi:hypothetical protein
VLSPHDDQHRGHALLPGNGGLHLLEPLDPLAGDLLQCRRRFPIHRVGFRLPRLARVKFDRL